MKRSLLILLFIGSYWLICYGQESGINVERANSLSRMADFYYTAHNYEKAIEQEKKALEMKSVLCGTHSLEYATSAFNLAKYYYQRGMEGEIDDKRSGFIYATEYAKKSMTIIKDSVLFEMRGLDYNSRYQLWQNVNTIFDSTYPSYVAKNPNDSTLSDLYNIVLFSKGITWRREGGINTMCWKDIRNALGENDIAIEFISPVVPSNDNMVFYALTLKKGYRCPKMTRLFDILQFQDSLKSCGTKVEKGQKIGKMVWAPLDNELMGIEKVYFSATHVLNNMPIEYMPITATETNNDRYCMLRVSSTQEIANNKARNHYNKAVLFGGLQYEAIEAKGEGKIERSGFEPLPNTGEEVTEIANVFENSNIDYNIYSGDEGTEALFKSLSGSSVDILHLATHGKYIVNNDVGVYHNGDDALTNSVLAFSGVNERPIFGFEQDDGIVTALDISQMNFPNLDLVSLSACESALGEYGIDDSIMGLQRGFKIAGANTILMSLGKVDDEATKILMIELYRNLMSGETKHQSLKDAQKHLRKVENGKYDKPEYWASFIMLDGLN